MISFAVVLTQKSPLSSTSALDPPAEISNDEESTFPVVRQQVDGSRIDGGENEGVEVAAAADEAPEITPEPLLNNAPQTGGDIIADATDICGRTLEGALLEEKEQKMCKPDNEEKGVLNMEGASIEIVPPLDMSFTFPPQNSTPDTDPLDINATLFKLQVIF